MGRMLVAWRQHDREAGVEAGGPGGKDAMKAGGLGR
jgi:hypothetical protein